jgi:dolichyl-phosphate-mannose--protein O-mannosyl transferase/Gpi18-like mannosyltransferase
LSSEVNNDLPSERTAELKKTGFLDKLKEPEVKAIVTLLVIALASRLVISLLFNTGHPTDINNFRAWTIESAKRGIHDFFLPPPKGIWCDYPPGYIYILYFLGKLYMLFDHDLSTWNTTPFTTFVKFPGIIADVANVYLIFRLTRRYIPFPIAITAATVYAWQPAVFYESAVWGQMDSVTVFFLLVSIIMLIDHKYEMAIFATCLNCLMKPQGILLIPFIGFVILYKKAFKQLLIGLLISFAFIFLITLPITESFTQVIPWLWEHYVAQANLYPFSSIQTFNLWALTGVWKNDSRTLLGITHKTWGLVLFIAFYASCLFYYVKKSETGNDEVPEMSSNKEKQLIEAEDKLKGYKTAKEAEINELNLELSEIRKDSETDKELKMRENQLEKLKKYKENDLEEANVKFEKLKGEGTVLTRERNEGLAIIHASALILLGFFLLPTRMHERYLFAGLSFLGVSAALNYRLLNLYYIISVTFLINLFYEFPGDKTNIGAPQFMTNFANFLKTGSMYTENFGVFWFTPLALLNIYIICSITYKLWRKPMVEVDEKELEEFELQKPEQQIETGKGFSVPALQTFDKTDWLIILGLSVISFCVRVFYLRFPEEMIFDEVYHARAAGEYLRGINPFEWVHPPLAKLLIASGVNIFGLNSFGWRIMPVIFGTFFIPVMYILGKSLFGRRSLGVVAALLVSLDGVFFVQSRTAMTNIFATFFQLTAVMFFWLYFQHDYHQEKKTRAYTFLALSGLFISLALASRWTSMGALAFILGALIWYKFFFRASLRELIRGNFSSLGGSFNVKEIPFWILVIVCFAILPVLIYIIAYIPYLSLNHTVEDIWNMQKGIFSYHKNLRDPHPYYSEWYTWPFLTRPTWYYFRDFKNGTMGGIIALGNPAIWWSSIFATIFVIYQGIKEKKSALLYVGLGFIVLYLPWAVSPRIKNFSHYLFEAIPYACLSLTYIVGYMWDKGNQKKPLTQEDKTFNVLAITAVGILLAGLLFIGFLALWTNQLKHPFPISFLEPYSQKMFDSASYLLISLLGISLYTLFENSKFRTLSVVYVGIVVALFIFFYPLYSGYPMYWWYYSLHIWFKSWI